MSARIVRPPLPVLTSLRFFAATEVVLYHEIYAAGQFRGANVFLRDLSSAGYQAVTFFFVLSGFILTYVYSGRSDKDRLNTSMLTFWQARVARLCPAYFLGLLVALPHFVYSAFVSKIISVPDFVLGLTLVPFLVQAWWPPTATSWNTPSWSLSVELLFYVLFPVSAFVNTRVSRNSSAVLAYGLVVAVSALRYAISDSGDAVGSAFSNFQLFFPLFHLPQFFFGMALGRLYLFGPKICARGLGAMFCAGTIGLVLIFSGRSLLPDWTETDAILVILFGLVIFGGTQTKGSLNLLASPVFTLMGEVSYSIYILHMPIGWLWNWATRKLALPSIVDFALYFTLVIALSLFSYLYVETPLRRWILGHREHRSA